MADVYMHSRLAEEVIKELKSDINRNIAFLGSQGPDQMYYVVLGKDAHKYRQVADDIHRYKTRDFLISMTDYVKENYTKDLYSYLVGYISHYALDATIHPYVYYNVGDYFKDKPETHHMRGLHLKFERAIDCLLIEKELGIPSRKLNLTKKYVPKVKDMNDILKLMDHSLKKVFKVDDGYNMYKNSFKQARNILKYISYDRFGIKKQIYKLVDFLTKDNEMILKDLSFFNFLENYDYHNEAHNTWLHPITGEEYTKSVSDMFTEAKDFAVSMINEVHDYITNNKEVDLNTVFTDLSYNTGIECKYGMDFKHIKVYK